MYYVSIKWFGIDKKNELTVERDLQILDATSLSVVTSCVNLNN